MSPGLWNGPFNTLVNPETAQAVDGLFILVAILSGPAGAARNLVKRRGTVSVLGEAYPKELAFAKELAGEGHDVIVRGRNAPGGDFWVDGDLWEHKKLEAATINAVRQALRAGLKQGSGRVYIDGRTVGLSHGRAIRAVRQHERANRMGRGVEVRILTRSGQVVWRAGQP